MSEQQLRNELELLKSGSHRPLHIDEAALISDFLHDQENEGTLGMKILSILGAFLATIFFLGFVFVADIYDSSAGLTITGLVLLGASFVLTRPKFAGLIADSFSVAFATCGYIMLLIGLAESLDSDHDIALLGAVLAAIIMVIHDNRIITFLGTVTVAGCLLYVVSQDWHTAGVHGFVGLTALLLTSWFVFEGTIIKVSSSMNRKYNSIRAGLIFALLMGAYYLSDFRWWMELERDPNWYVSVLLIPLVGLVAWQVLGRFVTDPKQRVTYLAGVLTLLLPTVFAPAICAALLVLILSWRSGYRVGTAIATIALIYFVSRYYYDLNLTLLTKSLILTASGVLFLMAYRVLHHKLRPQ